MGGLRAAENVTGHAFWRRNPAQSARALRVIDTARRVPLRFGEHEAPITRDTERLEGEHFPGWEHNAGRWLTVEDRTDLKREYGYTPFENIERFRDWGLTFLAAVGRIEGGAEQLASLLAKSRDGDAPARLMDVGRAFNEQRPAGDYTVMADLLGAEYEPAIRALAWFLSDRANNLTTLPWQAIDQGRASELLSRGRVWVSIEQGALDLLGSDGVRLMGVNMVGRGLPSLYTYGGLYLYPFARALHDGGMLDYLPRPNVVIGLAAQESTSLVGDLRRAAENGPTDHYHREYSDIALRVRNHDGLQLLEVRSERRDGGVSGDVYSSHFYFNWGRLLNDSRVNALLLTSAEEPSLLAVDG